MSKVLILGAGKIGSLISVMLANSGHYTVHVGDRQFAGADYEYAAKCAEPIQFVMLNAKDQDALKNYIQSEQIEAVISCLPYYCNVTVANVAQKTGIHYFDLTEDTSVSADIAVLAQEARTAFVPQCGLAPGFISIVANHLIESFQRVESVNMRVGALPLNVNNALQYSLTWSTDGLINEYGNTCFGIVDGKEASLRPLEGLEHIQIDGLSYEAFNTSGGLGTLTQTFAGCVKQMNYKTMRYPGHCEKVRLLVDDLKLNEDRATLKKILEHAIPKTHQDVVIVYVSVTGYNDNVLIEKNYLKKLYPQAVAGRQWSAIQLSTASGLCAVLDSVLAKPADYVGLVKQEMIPLDTFLSNEFGQYYGVSA